LEEKHLMVNLKETLKKLADTEWDKYKLQCLLEVPTLPTAYFTEERKILWETGFFTGSTIGLRLAKEIKLNGRALV
jgi:hypothetical protein